MSASMQANVWKSKLEASKKLVLLYYANCANDEGENVWPAVATVARNTGYSERTVQRITNQMIAERLLIRVGRGKKGTNRYNINVNAILTYTPPQPETRAENSENDPAGGDTVSGVTLCQGDIDAIKTTQGVTLTPLKGDTVTPNTLLNLKKIKHQDSAEAPNPPPKKSRADPRSAHPAILMIRHVTGKSPSRAIYDQIIQVMGEQPDEARFRRVFSEWVSRGYNPQNYSGLLEWYHAGIPSLRAGPNRAPVPRFIAPVAPQYSVEELAKALEESRAGGA